MTEGEGLLKLGLPDLKAILREAIESAGKQ